MPVDENGRVVNSLKMQAILTQDKVEVPLGHPLVITQYMTLSGTSKKDLIFADNQPLSAIGSRNTDQKDSRVIHRLRSASKKVPEEGELASRKCSGYIQIFQSKISGLSACSSNRLKNGLASWHVSGSLSRPAFFNLTAKYTGDFHSHFFTGFIPAMVEEITGKS
jgi:hypothetical protein